MIVYELLLEISNDDTQWIDSFIYQHKDNALRCMKELVEQYKTEGFIKRTIESENNSHYYETNIDEDAQEYYWEVTNPEDWYEHVKIEIRERRVR